MANVVASSLSVKYESGTTLKMDVGICITMEVLSKVLTEFLNGRGSKSKMGY